MYYNSRDTYVNPNANEINTVCDRLYSYKFGGGNVEPTIAFIEALTIKFTTNHPFSDSQKLTTMYEKMVDNKPMYKYCIKWDKKSDADKTWSACRTFFIDAAKEIKLKGTSESHIFHANFSKELQAALLDIKNVPT